MNILSKAISCLLLLIFVFDETRSKQIVVSKSLIILKLKLFFLLIFEYLLFYMGLIRCRLQTFDYIYILSKYISFLGFAFAPCNFFSSISIGFQQVWHASFRDSFHTIFMHIIKALVEYMFTLQGHLQHQEISSFVLYANELALVILILLIFCQACVS